MQNAGLTPFGECYGPSQAMHKEMRFWNGKWTILLASCVAIAAILLFIRDTGSRQAMRSFENRLRNCPALLIKASTQPVPGNPPTNFAITITNSLLISQLTSLAQENASRLRLHQSFEGGFGSMLCIAVYSPTPERTNLLFSIVGDSILYIDSNHYCESRIDLHETFLKTAFGRAQEH
jgi:hypothetical protein